MGDMSRGSNTRPMRPRATPKAAFGINSMIVSQQCVRKEGRKVQRKGLEYAKKTIKYRYKTIFLGRCTYGGDTATRKYRYIVTLGYLLTFVFVLSFVFPTWS